ncbi:MAG: acyl-CoA synthetase, partial [Acidimicrobiaceae bacterium]
MTDWGLRSIDPALERRWLDAGWWTDETLGQVLDRGLAEHGALGFTVRSSLRPHRGTFGAVL